MTVDHGLTDALYAWRDHAPAGDPHLDAATLYPLTGPEALAQADSETLAHLSLCPMCQGEWAEWRRARSATEDATGKVEDDLLVSCGFLLAAASPELADGVSLPSQCGSYRLDILPQREGGRVLAVFEVLVTGLMLEAATVSVRDRQGQVLLRGTIRDGRLARPVDRITDFDLSTWTVAIGRAANDG